MGAPSVRTNDPAAGTGLDHPVAFEFAVRPGDRIRVDGQIERERFDRGQLFAGLHRSERHRTLDLFDQLEVERNAAAGIDGEHCGHAGRSELLG
jgi:hypothetical protein